VLKYVGIALIMLTSWSIGYIEVKTINTKINVLESCIFMIDMLCSELRFSHSSSAAIINTLSCNNQLDKLDFIKNCNNLCRKGISFPIAYKQALNESQLPISDEDKKLLFKIGQVLGACDVNGQVELLAGIKTQMLSSMRQAKEAGTSKSKLYSTISFWGGIGIAILLI